MPVLSWDKVSGAVKYDVQVDNDPLFASPDEVAQTTNFRYVPKSRLAPGTQYWRVRAVNSANEASSWNGDQFEQASIDAPSQLTPDGAQLHQPDEPPLLSWTGVQGATGYTVEVDTDLNFTSPTRYNTQTTSIVVPLPLTVGPYYWRVTASLGTGLNSLPSQAATFEVLPLDPVVLTGPPDSPNYEVEDVVLNWDPVPGAQYYQLRVATDSSFATVVDNVTKIYGTQYSPKTTYNNNQYYWQVRAVDLAGQPTDWTTVQNNFNRVWPDRPQAVHPLGTVASPQHFSGKPFLQWTPVQHASNYQVDVGSDPNFSPNTYDSCLVAGTTYTFGGSIEPCSMPAGVVSYWRVRPMDRPFNTTGVQGLYSATQAVIWDADYFASFSPANGATVNIPTLSWQPARWAASYRIQLIDQNGSTVKTATTYSTSYTPVVTARLTAAKSPYTWKINAVTANGDSSLIYQRQFSVDDAPFATTGVDPLTPLTGVSGDPATVRAPVLSWEPDPAADHYRLFVVNPVTGTLISSTSANVFDKDLVYPVVTDTSTDLLKPGDYVWYVKSYNAANAVIATGPTASIQIAPLGAVQGQSVALNGTTLNGTGCQAHLNPDGVTGPRCDDIPATPVFDWAPVAGASSYMLYVSEDANFTNLLEVNVPSTEGTRFAFTYRNARATFPESQAGQAYYWFVRPCKVNGLCGPDPVSSTGMATNALRKLSPAPTGLTPGAPAPAGDAAPEVGTSEVNFAWDDYFDTNQATTWQPTGEAGYQSGKQYRIQVDNDSNFASPLEDQKVDQPTYTSADKMYPDGRLYWRVGVIDGDDNGLAWSSTMEFVKSSASADLSSPINDDHVPGTTPFRWSPQPFNASYRIELYKNNDLTFSQDNRIFAADNVKTSAYAWTKPIPPSAKPYVWRVRRNDAAGNIGQWSAAGRFYSTGQAPVLLTPADQAMQPAAGPLFTWSSVPGATRYQITILFGSTILVQDTVATAYAPTKSMPDGTLMWKVKAFDASNNLVGESDTWRIKVDAAAPKITSVSPTGTATPRSNFVIKLSEPVNRVSGRTFRLYRKGTTTPLAATVTVSADRMKAVLNPTANLQRGKRYVAKVRAGITDDANNPLPTKKWVVLVQ